MKHSRDHARQHGRGTRGARRGRIAALAASAAVCALPLTGVTAAQAAPIDGEPSIGDSLFKGIGNTGYDVTHYDVDLDYTKEAAEGREAGSIEATTTITAQAPEELGSFTLDFEGLDIDALTVNGEDAAFERSEDKSIEAFKVRVTPAAPVQGEFTVEVQYSGVPEEHVDLDGSSEGWVETPDGATALGQPVGTMAWIPSNNTPADKATFDIAVTAPTEIGGAPAAAVSNGELVAQEEAEGGKTTWQWSQQNQMATMATMVSIGNYDVHEGEITLSDGRTIPEWSFVDSAIAADRKADIDARRGEIQEITQFLESEYGPYPGNSTGVVVDVTSLGYALETQDRSYFERGIGKSTLVHEIAHQWFGDGVTPADWNSIWISEGQATYAEERYAEAHDEDSSTAEAFYGIWDGTPADAEEWTIAPAAMTDPRQLFDWQSYDRGGMTFEALRQSIGDEAFEQVLTEWPTRNMGESNTTEGFIALAEEISGHDLGAFFQDWVYDADKPAWPSTWDLSLSADPEGGEVEPGSGIAYTLGAESTGQVPLEGAVAEVDLADVLDDAELDEADLPEGASLEGDVLTWTVPETDETASATFQVRVADDSDSATLAASARATTLGATCTSCTTEHTTPAAGPGDDDGSSDAGAGAEGSSDSSGSEADGSSDAGGSDSAGTAEGSADAGDSGDSGDSGAAADGSDSGIAETGSNASGLWIAGGVAALVVIAGAALLVAARRKRGGGGS